MSADALDFPSPRIIRRAPALIGLCLVLGTVVGCKKKPPAPPVTSEAAIVFKPEALQGAGAGAGNTVDRPSFLATQAEVIQSRWMRDRLIERLQLSEAELAKVPPRMVTATPRGDTWILDVRGHLPHPNLSTHACSALLDEYLTRRHLEATTPLFQRQRALAERLDALDPEKDAAEVERLRHQLDAVALQLTSAPMDANVLEPCRPVLPPTRGP